jgi:antitoxin component of RelBE/YafQ-DinJ toxin-antitoxin module
MAKNTKIISTTIDTERKAKLEAFANERGLKKSQVIRTAIDSVIKGEYNRPATAYALVQLCREVEELETKYEGVVDSEVLKSMKSKLATLIDCERVGR